MPILNAGLAGRGRSRESFEKGSCLFSCVLTPV